MADDRVFPDEFLPNLAGASAYDKWKQSNSGPNGDYTKWVKFRDDVLAGSKPTPPTMATKNGKFLVAAGKLHMSVTDIGSGDFPPTTPPSTSWPGNYTAGPAGAANILPSRQGVLTGIWDSGAVGTNQIKAREAQVGRLFDLGTASYGPAQTANSDGKLTLIKNEGRIPMCSMHSSNDLSRLNSGVEDAWHTASATAVRNLGVPTFVRLLHEFNGYWQPFYWHTYVGDGSPSNVDSTPVEFVNAWQRIVNLWRNAGATNACFVWHYASSNGVRASSRYPGNAWVDWTANSNYTYADTQYVGFYQDYADAWQLMGWAREYRVSDPTRYNNPEYKPIVDQFAKPHMLGELGHFNDPTANRKSTWFTNMKANLQGTFDAAKENGDFSNVLALLYSDYVTPTDDWIIDHPVSGLTGFTTMVNDSYFKTRSG